ncbi:GNAT family N-acetyltransferase [Streptomyces sp. MUM 178J]|uniref:GNAT family N-acetyltransferase n=1 Tax=Streptomyces sp. MUM 178J TaxID=2791991 RepID=UPI001F0366B8|nr:GNAT family N-acetyltransferase [Streptomyces sp. MUM 178J]WRQ82994.1 GNAT family N-acetyltransferase [Streptomyces sp. MUM 178J]
MTHAHADTRTPTGTRTPIDIRTLTDSEFPDWLRVLNTGFLRAPTPTDRDVETRRSGVVIDRTQGAFDDSRCVATFRSFPQEITAVGGAAVAASAVTNVSVSPTHRRRGLLSRMMAKDLAAAKERGDVVSTLIAAEYPIYGRFGFGPAVSVAEWTVDVPRSGLDPRRPGPSAEDGGRVDLATADEVRKEGPALHERLRAEQHGVVNRTEHGWKLATGELTVDYDPWKEPYYALYRSASGEVEGLVAYRADDKWSESGQPQNTATVQDLIAVTPAAERALWHFVCSVDWVTAVTSGFRAPDDVLPLLLPDRRAARLMFVADFLWVRLLDVVRALEARTYPVPGALVLDVRDEAGLAGGRFRLDAGPEGASCAPTDASPDLTLDVGTLGSLWLGDESAVRLAALGHVTEETAGAAGMADVLFRTARRPWCPDVF